MISIVIPIRLSSSRLPRKHLIDSNSRPFVEWLLLRLRAGALAGSPRPVVIATTTDREDDDIASLASRLGAECFRGAPLNIPERLCGAARSVGASGFVCVDGDDICCANEAVAAAAEAIENGAKSAVTVGLPLGMNASAFVCSELEDGLAAVGRGIIQTGWTRVLRHAPTAVPMTSKVAFHPRLRVTLDYPEDAVAFDRIITLLGNAFVAASADQIIETANLADVVAINGTRFDEYWQNYRAEAASEILS